MSRRFVRVTKVGYFEIKEENLQAHYEAETYEEALENQRQWIKDGSCSTEELLDENLPIRVELEIVDNIFE